MFRTARSLWNLAGTLHISDRYNSNYRTPGFKISHDLIIRRLIKYWNGALLILTTSTEKKPYILINLEQSLLSIKARITYLHIDIFIQYYEPYTSKTKPNEYFNLLKTSRIRATGEFPVTRKLLPFDDVIVLWSAYYKVFSRKLTAL